MAYKTPWSNFHELNLDWVLQQVKNLREDVDGLIGSATPSDAAPEMDGAGTPGTSVTYSRGDHRHPTDTSRAAQSDLTQEITDRGNADLALAGDIADVDAKIKFSSAAPIMDSSSASAGFSDYMARADHIHPTDTSRASASAVANLEARMDAFAGSANPSDSMPVMDGAGTAGSGANYSRGDHQHPADTSKLDKSGGTITGDLSVEGDLTPEKLHSIAILSAPGWYKAANIPFVGGTMVTVTITRNETTQPQEVHQFDLCITNSGAVFKNETSTADTKLIDQIRYTNVGILDLHYDQAYANSVSVDLEIHAPTSALRSGISAGDFTLRSNTPGGETVLLAVNLSSEASFLNKGDIYRIVATYSTVIASNNGYTKVDDFTSLGIPAGDRCLSFFMHGFSLFPSYGLIFVQGSDGVSFYLAANDAGTYSYSVDYWFIKQ